MDTEYTAGISSTPGVWAWNHWKLPFHDPGPSTPMSGADSRPLRMPENSSVEMATTVNVASSTCVKLKRMLATPSDCQFSRQRMTSSQAAIKENTHQDCVDSPRPSS